MCISRAGAEHGACASGASQQHLKTQRIRALNSWASSHARHLTKDLGACSPRETHMKEPTSAHKLSSYVLLVDTPICPNAGKQGSNPPQAASRAKMPRQGTQHPLQDKTPREAKSKNLVISLAGFFASRVSPHGPLARQRGAPEHRASRALTSSASHPPALSSPVSHTERRCC